MSIACCLVTCKGLALVPIVSNSFLVEKNIAKPRQEKITNSQRIFLDKAWYLLIGSKMDILSNVLLYSGFIIVLLANFSSSFYNAIYFNSIVGKAFINNYHILF